MTSRDPNSPFPSESGGTIDSDEALLSEILRLNPAIGNVAERFFLPPELAERVPADRLLRVLERIGKSAGVVSQPPQTTALRLAANGYPRLHAYLADRGQTRIGADYRTLRLLDFGTESLVFLATDACGGLLALKVPFLDYTNLAYMDVLQLRRRRARLAREAEVLTHLRGTALPGMLSSWTGENPFIPAGLPTAVRIHEQFVAMEFISGPRCDVAIRSYRQQGRMCCALLAAARLARVFVELSATINERIGAVYTDVKPQNALLAGTAVRVVDGSSIVPADVDPQYVPVSAAYLHPVDYQRWRDGVLVPDAPLVLRSVVRAVRSLLGDAVLEVGRDAPSWPQEVPAVLTTKLDALENRDQLEFAEAAKLANNLDEGISCDHQNDGGTVVASPI